MNNNVRNPLIRSPNSPLRFPTIRYRALFTIPTRIQTIIHSLYLSAFLHFATYYVQLFARCCTRTRRSRSLYMINIRVQVCKFLEGGAGHFWAGHSSHSNSRYSFLPTITADLSHIIFITRKSTYNYSFDSQLLWCAVFSFVHTFV